MKRIKYWILGLGLLGLVAAGLVLRPKPPLAPATAPTPADGDTPLVVLSSKGIGQDPNQVELLERIEAQGSSEGLDFSGRDLTALDLSAGTLADIVQLRRLIQSPIWLDPVSGGGNLTGMNFAGALLLEADLNRAKLVAANFQSAQLVDANLSQTNLALANLSAANLTAADLAKSNLAKADMVGADLSFANLADTDLWRADLENAYVVGTDLSRARLAFTDLSHVNLGQARSLDGVSLYQARLTGTILRRDLLGGAVGEERAEKYEQARQVYLALKNNFRDTGQYDDARWAAVKERTMEQATHWPGRAVQFYKKQELVDLPEAGLSRYSGLATFYLKHSTAFGLLWLWGLTSGYNHSPLRVALTSLVLWLGLAVFYRVSGGLVSAAEHRASALDYLGYSFGTLTRYRWRDLEPARRIGQIVAQLTWLVTVGLIALMVVTLST